MSVMNSPFCSMANLNYSETSPMFSMLVLIEGKIIVILVATYTFSFMVG
jgi:hypothetical protein